MQQVFRRFADWASELTGTVWAFTAATFVIAAWALTGPVFGFSDTWQLIINTGTTVITFLMVFLIQATQNRDNKALHAKLDELIIHTHGAHNELAAAESFSDEELKEIQDHFQALGVKGGTDAGDGREIASIAEAKSKAPTRGNAQPGSGSTQNSHRNAKRRTAKAR
jgi:low affinity Fe/Cu permease